MHRAKIRLVLIEWLDSFGCSASWQELGNCTAEPLCKSEDGWRMTETVAR